jgi:hypothetical protein
MVRQKNHFGTLKKPSSVEETANTDKSILKSYPEKSWHACTSTTAAAADVSPDPIEELGDAIPMRSCSAYCVAARDL